MAAGSHSAEMPTKAKRRIIDARAQQQAQHAATISLIVKNTGKIQKEIGFRRARLKVRRASYIFRLGMDDANNKKTNNFNSNHFSRQFLECLSKMW